MRCVRNFQITLGAFLWYLPWVSLLGRESQWNKVLVLDLWNELSDLARLEAELVLASLGFGAGRLGIRVMSELHVVCTLFLHYSPGSLTRC